MGLAAPAAAADPSVGRWHGDNIGFHIDLTPHGSLHVAAARWHSHQNFEKAYVHAGTFDTCARVRINAVLFKDLCIHAEFTGHHTAAGTLKVYLGAHGHVAAHPSETHPWTAAYQG